MDHLFGGGISFRISIDPDVESASPDSIIMSESAKNDFFSKPRLHYLYVGVGQVVLVLGREVVTERGGGGHNQALYAR